MGSMGGRLEQQVSRACSQGKQASRRREGGFALTSDLGGRASFAGRDHDKQLHDGVVDFGAARLYNEDILLTDAVGNLDARLALEKAHW